MQVASALRFALPESVYVPLCVRKELTVIIVSYNFLEFCSDFFYPCLIESLKMKTQRHSCLYKTKKNPRILVLI